MGFRSSSAKTWEIDTLMETDSRSMSTFAIFSVVEIDTRFFEKKKKTAIPVIMNQPI